MVGSVSSFHLKSFQPHFESGFSPLNMVQHGQHINFHMVKNHIFKSCENTIKFGHPLKMRFSTVLWKSFPGERRVDFHIYLRLYPASPHLQDPAGNPGLVLDLVIFLGVPNWGTMNMSKWLKQSTFLHGQAMWDYCFDAWICTCHRSCPKIYA